MKRTSTPSFILTLKLNTNLRQDALLNDRFYAAWKIRNQIAKYAFKQLNKLKTDKRYKELLNSHSSKQRNIELDDIRKQYGLSECQLQHWAVEQLHRYKRYVDADTVQKIATQVWQGTSACLFGKGESINVCSYSSFTSIEGKRNCAGIKYRNGYIDWLGERFAVQIRHDDIYAKEALMHKVKYCRIVRKPVGQRYHYYVQLILEGMPPKKHQYLSEGIVGIDPGVSTEAVVTPDKCILTEIAPERKNISDEAAALQQAIDRSLRVNNPNNYNADGTTKKHVKQWRISKRCKRLKTKYAALRRKNAEYVHQEEEKFANLILETCGSDIVAEKMNYKALQKRKKQKGQFSFGKPLSAHSPAKLLNVLSRKLGYIGKDIYFVNTAEYKASQYNHVDDLYVKNDLNVRSKLIGGVRVQRDLYSAFLLMCAEDDLHPNRNVCFSLFPDFIEHHNSCISILKQSNNTYPQSFGLSDF